MSSVSCPKCSSPMKLKRGSTGHFYSCVQYPTCKGTRPAGGSASVSDSSGKWRSGGAHRMKAKFPGRCSNCNAAVAEGDSILYEDRKVVGCDACSPAAVSAPPPGASAVTTPTTSLAALLPDTQADAAWKALLAVEHVPERYEPIPLSVERCHAIPLCAFELDEYQGRVVRYRKGKAVVAAGAGSGKTTVSVERAAALVREGVAPESILMLVYNRDALSGKDGIKTRLLRRFGPHGTDIAERINAFTFHGWAYTMLNQWYPGRFGRGKIVGVDDGPSSFTLAKRAIDAAKLEGVDPQDMVKLSELVREALIDLDAPDVVTQVENLPTKPTFTLAMQAIHFTRAYQREKARLGVIDFADMLWMVNKVIDQGGQRAEALTRMFTHVMVDEGQDINPARLRIAKHLASRARSFVIVGDLRQSIYGFTGARPDLFRSLLDDGFELLTLPINRRSTGPIVDAGNAVADGRDWNLGGACSPSPDKRGPAEPVQIWWNTETPGQEADAIVQEVLARVATDLHGGVDGHTVWNPQEGRDELFLKDDELRKGLVDRHGKSRFCCLVRTNAQAAALECAFMVRRVPVRVLGAAGGVWATSPGKEVLAYLRAAEGRADKDLTRVSNKPNRFLKRAIVEEAVTTAEQLGVSIFDTLGAVNDRGAIKLRLDLRQLENMEWEPRCREVLRLLLRDLDERASEADGVGTPDEDKEAAYKGLVEAAISLGSVAAIEAQIKAMEKVGDKEPAVEISTIHRSKGSEWEVVFVCGVAVGTLPHRNSLDDEEERRLFYVALTRGALVVIVSVGGEEASPFLEALRKKPPEEGGDENDDELPGAWHDVA